jgi:threonylcarbamoyladenosine tRNA methylthiotransferase MtaB
MKFAISTLGCKINQYESQLLREGLLAAGHTEHPFTDPGADWYIVNTCTVTHRSDADARKLVRRALRHGGRVMVTGCQAVVSPDEIRSIASDMIVAPPAEIYNILHIAMPRFISDFDGHSRAFVKVQQGCNMYCSYCIVPHAKGFPMSRRWEDIITEVENLHQRGYKEVVLTGINIGLYEGGLARLVEKVIERTSIERIRISSLEPWTLEDALMKMVVEEPRVCKHLHLPLQHGSDSLLKIMGRPYTSSYFRSLVDKIHTGSEKIAVGSDIIVGFPGENEKTFEECFRFIAGTRISYLHVFPFSPRPGTAAYHMDHPVDDVTVKQRAGRLRELSREKKQVFSHSCIGSVEGVLVTRVCPGFFFGITSNYLTVQVKSAASEGDIVNVRVTGMEGLVLQGEYLG